MKIYMVMGSSCTINSRNEEDEYPSLDYKKYQRKSWKVKNFKTREEAKNFISKIYAELKQYVYECKRIEAANSYNLILDPATITINFNKKLLYKLQSSYDTDLEKQDIMFYDYEHKYIEVNYMIDELDIDL